MATRSRKSCVLRDFLGFEWPDDDSDAKNTFACFCMRPALLRELYEIFALPGVLYENLAHNRALYGIYTCLYMVLLL